MYIPPESRLWSVGMTEGEDESEETEKNDKTTQNLLLLRHLCSLSSKHREIFVGLMTEVNLKGYTPFMTAVSCKVSFEHAWYMYMDMYMYRLEEVV